MDDLQDILVSTNPGQLLTAVVLTTHEERCRKVVPNRRHPGGKPRPPTPEQNRAEHQCNVRVLFDRIVINSAQHSLLSLSGNRYLLIAMDYITKWLEVYATSNSLMVADILGPTSFDVSGSRVTYTLTKAGNSNHYCYRRGYSI
jgi:hypothetical protein